MAKTKSTKTYADNNALYKLIKGKINNSYFLEVLYYHVRLALIKKNFNLYDLDAFNISGKYLGYDFEVDLNRQYNNVIKSLGLVLSLRAFMINSKYFKCAYNDELLFYSISSNYLTWDGHRIIMECSEDEDFSSIYKMIISYQNDYSISEELLADFKDKTVNPGYQHHEEFCKKLAARDDYHGKTVIKNNEFFNSDMETFVVNKVVEYIGNTVFAYCNNLKKIEFEGKVLFGYFPIIECNHLQHIIVPTDLLDYYKQALPYYKNIISDHEEEFEDHEAEAEKETQVEKVEEAEKAEEPENVEELEIEHVYVNVSSADPYVETEIEESKEQEEEEPAKEVEIDFTTLEKIFEKKATSYKYFWFLSIISLARERKQLEISYKDIVIRMAAMAWPMVFDDEIDLGRIDMMSKYLSEVEKSTKLIPAATSNVVEKYLQQHYQSQGVERILSPLLKNVPYRFLSPWIQYTNDEDVKEKSNRNDFAGFYSLADNSIVLKEAWWNYINDHYRDICNTAKASFIDYVSQYNDGIRLLKLKMGGISYIV